MELGVARRTVCRYVQSLEDAFYPYLQVDSSKDGYKISKSEIIETLVNTGDYEGISVIAASPLNSIMDKSPVIPGDMASNINTILDLHKTARPEILKPLFDDLRKGSLSIIQYHSKNGVKTHHCFPVKLFADYYALYTICFDKDHGHLITLAVNRMENVQSAGEKLAPVLLAEFRNYISSAWGKMIRHDLKKVSSAEFLLSNSYLPFFLKSPLHETQTIRQESERFYVTLKIHNPIEFVRWSMRFGTDLKILGPKEVLSELRNYLTEMRYHYEIK